MLKAVHSLFAFHKHNVGLVPVTNVSKAVKSVFYVVNKLALEMLRNGGTNVVPLYDMLFRRLLFLGRLPYSW